MLGNGLQQNQLTERKRLRARKQLLAQHIATQTQSFASQTLQRLHNPFSDLLEHRTTPTPPHPTTRKHEAGRHTGRVSGCGKCLPNEGPRLLHTQT